MIANSNRRLKMSCVSRLMVAVSILLPVLAADAQSLEKPWQHADGRVEF